MNISNIKIQRASDARTEPAKIFVELSLKDGGIFADVEEVNGKTVVNLYSPPKGNCWTIPYDDFVAALAMGKEQLQFK